MGSFLRKYAIGSGSDVYIPIIKRASIDFAVGADWTPAAGDVKISIDGAAAANIATLPVAVAMGNTAMWKFVFSNAELTGKFISVFVADSATKVIEDQALVIETYGNASALHAFDLATALQTVDVTKWNGTTVATPDTAGYVKATIKDGTGTGEIDTTSGKVAITDGAITTATFAAGAINAAAIATDAITAAKIAADAIGASEIADGAIDAATFASGAINAAAIAADAITAAKIADGAIDAATFAASAITATVIASDAITAAKIADGAIDAATFAAGAINAAAIATDAITAAKIAADAIGAAEIADGAIDAATFASGAITAAAIATDAIGAAELAADAVTEIQSGLSTLTAAGIRTAVGLASANLDTQLTAHQSDLDDIQTRIPAALVSGRIDASVGAMASGVVTATAIASDAITAAKIADGAIDAATFAASAITATVLAADAITAAKIADGAIDAATFASGAITAAAIAADAIGSSELASTAVDEIVDAVWDELTSGHSTSGTTGKKLADLSTGSGLDAAGVRAAIGMATADLDDQLSNIDATLDSELLAIKEQTNLIPSAPAAVSDIPTAAEINAEMVDVLTVDTIAEPTAVPASTAPLAAKIGWLMKLARNVISGNKVTGVLTVYNDDGTTPAATALATDDGTTSTRGEWT